METLVDQREWLFDEQTDSGRVVYLRPAGDEPDPDPYPQPLVVLNSGIARWSGA